MSYQRLNKIRSTAIVAVGGTLTFFGICIAEGNERFYKNLLMPGLRTVLDAEQAHLFAIKMANLGLVPNMVKSEDDKILSVKVFNREFSNPIGLAAGFDKHGEAMKSLFGFGFGFVEVGSVTPLPQDGNPKPRVFRLDEDRAVINRYGFNSHGHDTVFQRIVAFREANTTKSQNRLLGINLGKNKTSTDALDDYKKGLKLFATLADYLVINISSPNTPGLRSLQNKKELEHLLDGLIEERDKVRKDLPIILKIAPDLNDEELEDIVQTVCRPNKKIDGLIVSNTTISRPSSLHSSLKTETGGLSGEPLKQISNQTIEKVFKLTNGKIPIIGCGGVSNGHDALDKIKSGSTLVQIYTSFSYDGPPIVNKIKKELTALLKQEGFSNVNEAIGANIRNK